MLTNTDKILTQFPKPFYCECCEYNTGNKKDYNNHLLTRKHMNAENKSTIFENKFICSCGNEYKHRQSLFTHKKKCTHLPINEPIIENTFVQAPAQAHAEPIDHAVLFEILKQNQEFRELMLEQNNKIMEQNEKMVEQNEKMVEQNEKIIELSGKIGNTTNNNIKKQNNNFNLNFFLNETCKNAISLTDFIESLQINTQTAEYMGKHGFINGTTNIFMDGLKQLEVHMRPIHCTDAKRETMYVKGDEWEKDDETNPKMKAAIKDISNKNIKQLPIWIEENPDSKIVGTDKYEEQIQIMIGMLDVRKNNEHVIKNIAKQVLIDKNV
jgi:hypothetical protein